MQGIKYKIDETVNRFLLAGDQFMSQDLRIVLVEHLQKTKKEYKRLKKQKIHEIFIKTN